MSTEMSDYLILWKKYGLADPKASSDGTSTWTLTTGARDRENERVYPPGCDTTSYIKNPVVLAFHDSRSFPIGSCTSLRLVGSGWNSKLVGDLKPAPAGLSADVDAVHGMIQAGLLRACSIGFLSKRRELGPEGTLDHLETELLEFSIVSVPANPEALRVAGYRGLPQRRTRSAPAISGPALRELVGILVRRQVQAAVNRISGRLD